MTIPNRHWKSLATCILILLLAGETARGQQAVQGAYGLGGRQGAPATQYFGGGANMNLGRQPLQRQVPGPQPVQLAGSAKPFQNIHRPPALSPYLSLDLINDSGTGLPNYYAFFQPQMQQRQANEAQQAQIRRLQQQVRVANSTGALSNNSQGGMPTTGHSSQFMNLGGYFPAMR